jgi:hypothetical protein
MQYSDRSNPSKFVQNVDYESFLEDSDLSDFEMYEKIYHFEDSLDLYDSDDYFGEQD